MKTYQPKVPPALSSCIRAGVGAAVICIGMASSFPSLAQTPSATSSDSNPTAKKTPMTQRATGTFDVKLQPLAVNDKFEGDTRGRMSINKEFKGDLEGTTKGEMLMAGTAVKGSAGYVAMETVTGKLHGKSGTFVLMHQGIMNRGAPSLLVTVVPDSGTGDLVGLAGKLNIIIEGGKHSYEFDYTIEPKP